MQSGRPARCRNTDLAAFSVRHGPPPPRLCIHNGPMAVVPPFPKVALGQVFTTSPEEGAEVVIHQFGSLTANGSPLLSSFFCMFPASVRRHADGGGGGPRRWRQRVHGGAEEGQRGNCHELHPKHHEAPRTPHGQHRCNHRNPVHRHHTIDAGHTV